MSALRAIHATRRAVGLDQDDEAWRALLERTTGQRSSKGLSPVQSKAVLSELNRLTGNKVVSRGSRKRLEGPYAGKLQALWIACWNMGLISDADDEALNTFAKRQAKVGHANWIREHHHAVSVIEALKKMLEREGVDWSPISDVSPAYINRPGYRIAMGQWRKIGAEPWFEGMSFARYVNTLVGRFPQELDGKDWIVVMNALGRRIRAKAEASN